MHGLIVNQLRQFVVEAHGREAWAEINRSANVALGDRPSIDGIYDDADVIAAVVAAATLTHTEPQALLGAFGAFLAPTLLRVYAPLIDSRWRTLDIIEHTEEHIHTAVRLRDPSAGPPYLTATRPAPDRVVVHYTSPRRLCGVAEGIVRGIADSLGDRVTVRQSRCMLRGDTECEIVVATAPPAA